MTRDSVALIVLALAICGSGLGLCVPPLTVRSGVMSVASRHAGLIVGLLLLSPLLAHNLSSQARQAQTRAAGQVLSAPLPISTKLALGVDLLHTVRTSSGGQVPNLNGPFTRARAQSGASPALDALQRELIATERSALAAAFAKPFAVAALLAFAALASFALLPERRRAAPRRRHLSGAVGEDFQNV